MAFTGIPNETRKSFKDGTTIFERVLPGADRMYPDTDSKPIPLPEDYIVELRKHLPEEVIDRYHKLKAWDIPEDTYTYIFKKNLFPLVERIINTLKISPMFVGTFFGHYLKCVEGQYTKGREFKYDMIYGLFAYLQKNSIDLQLAKRMITVIYEHPKMDFESVLTSINFKKINKEEIVKHIPFLKEKFAQIRTSSDAKDETNWIMGELYQMALGNMTLSQLQKLI